MLRMVLWSVLGLVVLMHGLTVFVLWRVRCARRRGEPCPDTGKAHGFLWSMTDDRDQCIGTHHGRMFQFPMYDVMAYAHIPLNAIYRFWRHVWYMMFAPWPEDDSGLHWLAYWKKRALAAEEELTRIRMEEEKDEQ